MGFKKKHRHNLILSSYVLQNFPVAWEEKLVVALLVTLIYLSRVL